MACVPGDARSAPRDDAQRRRAHCLWLHCQYGITCSWWLGLYGLAHGWTSGQTRVGDRCNLVAAAAAAVGDRIGSAFDGAAVCLRVRANHVFMWLPVVWGGLALPRTAPASLLFTGSGVGGEPGGPCIVCVFMVACVMRACAFYVRDQPCFCRTSLNGCGRRFPWDSRGSWEEVSLGFSWVSGGGFPGILGIILTHTRKTRSTCSTFLTP
jgi:hypothetical protein